MTQLQDVKIGKLRKFYRFDIASTRIDIINLFRIAINSHNSFVRDTARDESTYNTAFRFIIHCRIYFVFISTVTGIDLNNVACIDCSQHQREHVGRAYIFVGICFDCDDRLI